MVNITACGNYYMSNAPNNTTLVDQWGWRGHVIGLKNNPLTQVSRAGCDALCGTGNDYYDWAQASQTITTWILPVIGVILQAPFESNAFMRTMLALTRWIGSPMASLSYVLWNIKVTGKCGVFVDMAAPYDERNLDPNGDYASIRDSFYILMTMNQYSIKPLMSLQKEAEGFLRIVLFSKDLKLLGTRKSLAQTRQKLAREMRQRRRRGVVPVYISTLWFLFALAISIQSAFGQLGQNTTAHDLALGFLLAWLPVLILGSIVDRNPIAAEDIRRRLNALVNKVRDSLQDDATRQAFIESFRDQPEAHRMAEWVKKIYHQSGFEGDFFVRFAGQGTVRWHYGAAHPILSDIENAYIAEHGRNWLQNEEEARTNLVLGPVDEGLVWFDFRELWQISAAIAIVVGTVAGAFILSFFTPTVGLGCRSGGYLVFVTISFGLLIAELLVWWLVSPVRMTQPDWLARRTTRLQSTASYAKFEGPFRGFLRKLKDTSTAFTDFLEGYSIKTVSKAVDVLPGHDKSARRDSVESYLQRKFSTFHNLTLQERTERFFFRPAEFINMSWLIYITIAQTFGSYRNCNCITSGWARGGGYVDFTQQDVTNSPWLKWYWTTGTVIGSTTMGVSMLYIVAEWMLQSHLSTEDYDSAQRGLQRSRRYRRLTYPIRRSLRVVFGAILEVNDLFYKCIGIKQKQQMSLLWTKNITHPSCKRPTRFTPFPTPSGPSIELHDIEGQQFQFSRHRAESDSHSQIPLIRTPDATHHWDHAEPLLGLRLQTSPSNTPRLSTDSPLSPPEEQPGGSMFRPTFSRHTTDQGPRGRSSSDTPIPPL